MDVADEARPDRDGVVTGGSGRGQGDARVVTREPTAAKRSAAPARKARRQRKRRAMRVLEFVGGTLGIVALLAVLVAAAVHVRLAHGSISLGPVHGWIQTSLASQLAPWRIELVSAALVRSEERGLEVELSGVALKDGDDRTIARVPLVRVTPSLDGLWRGQIGAERIAIVGPRLELASLFSAGIGEAGAGATTSTASTASTATAPGTARPGAVERIGAPPAASRPAPPPRFDLARLLAHANERAREGEGSAGALRSIALEDVGLVLDHSVQGAEWRIPHLLLDMEHRQKRSALALEASLSTARGPWRLAVQIDDREKSDLVTVEVRMRDLVPRAITGMHPALAMLGGLSMPIDADARVVLGRDGRLREVTLDLVARPGSFLLPGHENAPVAVAGARVRARYDAEHGQIVVEPSAIEWDGGHATLVGAVLPLEGPDGRTRWNYRLTLAPAPTVAHRVGEAALPVESLLLEGLVEPDRGRLELTHGEVSVAGGRLALGGWSERVGETNTGLLYGSLEQFDLAPLVAVWPRQLAPQTRTWVKANVGGARITSGAFEIGRPKSASGEPGVERGSMTLQTEAASVVVHPALPALVAPRATVRVEGEGLEISVPSARMALARGGKLALSKGRYTLAGLRDRTPLAEVEFHVQGPLSAATRTLQSLELAPRTGPGAMFEGVEGKIDGRLRLRFVPPASGPLRRLESTEGRVRISEVRARNVVPGFHLSNATVDVTLDDRAIDVQGDLLLKNLPVKLAWQRLLGTDVGAIPPVRLTARLDAADRAALGLDIEKWVRGEVPVEVTVQPLGNGELRTRVLAGLTGAELHFPPIAWRKTAGRPASLEFEIARADKQSTELQNVRLRGEGLAIEGSALIGPDHSLRELALPTFSVGVLGNLAVHATAGPGKATRVTVKGSAFDGQDYFRALLAGAVDEEAAPRPSHKRVPEMELNLQIDHVVGFHQATLRGLYIRLRQQGTRLAALEGRGILDGGAPLTLALARQPGGGARLLVTTTDAGSALKLVGLYSAMSGGRADLALDLDETTGRASRGVLGVRNFTLLGQPVVVDVASITDEAGTSTRSGRSRRVVREAIPFDRIHLPFRLGPGHMSLTDTRINGPLIGATLRGRIGLADHRLALSGTFTPLRGINAALSQIPLLGELITGSRGEGIIAINFALRGSLEEPEVLVHPLSPMAPGILRELFQIGPDGLDPAAGSGETTNSARRANGERPAGERGAAPAVPADAQGRVLDGWSTESRRSERGKTR
jgi:hypothetical protein